MIRTDTRLFPILFAALGLAVGLFAFMVWPAYAKEGSAPAKPTGLSATASHDQVTLTWDDPGRTTQHHRLRHPAARPREQSRGRLQ